ncbi:YciI family protein [Actinomadura sp. ATCC 31491]|uniref:YciI family protein n=1 Tax=Actinomadura luzonensis TaxID=2805427 RepID=A0ABT0FLV2_9ACTN|nr:YciI family protein [Actinomadura luzonensis]MCK2213261.1 YciI family protein [Actinomadura luzonensis]
MILSYASQRDYDAMSGAGDWSGEAVAAMHQFMETFNKELAESGELVETRALAAPVHTRRMGSRGGEAFVTDGPYAETQEVLAGYWIVECESFDRACGIAARLGQCPYPGDPSDTMYADVRPIMDSSADLEL